MTATLVFLIQALFIIALPFVVARFLRLRGVVPIVVVQIVGGIALGPSLFGRISPEFHRLLFDPATLTPLSGIASIAILFFGFITGLHLETATFHGRGRAFGLVAVASVAVPTVAGFLAGLWIVARFPEEIGPGINPAAFAAAIGIATGVTALPVLGAILHEMKLLGQRIGDLALGLAAVNDV